jgi:CelD/BcsL family acetyltransferase involved in cellulose biosynthesis
MSEVLVSAATTQTRLCQTLQDAPLGRTAWNRILRRSETRSVFLTWQWLSNWWECCGVGAELYCVAVIRNDELIGIVPLQLRHADGVRVLEFLGRGSSDVCDVIASAEEKPEVLAALWESLERRRDRWDRIDLRNVPEQSSTARILAQLPLPEDCELSTEVEAPCPVLSIERNRGFAESCTRKKSLVRHARYFERLAPLQYQPILDLDEINDLLPIFFEQHRDRRFMAGDRSAFEDRQTRRFYERVTTALLESGWLHFAVLRWRDEILAIHYGFLYDGVFTWYLPTFNVDYARYSPGEVMIQKLLEAAIESGVREFDFTPGDAPYKERFANVKRQVLRIELRQQGRADSTRTSNETAAQASAGGFLQRLLAPLSRRSPEPRALTGAPVAGPIAVPRLGVARSVLWRLPDLPAVPSEYRVRWASYSQIKALTRQEGLKTDTLITALARMQRGERAAVCLWQERPVALVWLARNPRQVLAELGFDYELPEGAALLIDSHVVQDMRGSPRRETLTSVIVTFLAAEGVSSLFGFDLPGTEASLPTLCGTEPEPVVQRTDVGLLLGRWSFQRRLGPTPG